MAILKGLFAHPDVSGSWTFQGIALDDKVVLFLRNSGA